MELILFYTLFAFTTAFAAVYELFWPVLQNIKHTKPEAYINNIHGLTLGTCFMLALLFAPIIVVCCIVPSVSQRFRTSFQQSLLS